MFLLIELVPKGERILGAGLLLGQNTGARVWAQSHTEAFAELSSKEYAGELPAALDVAAELVKAADDQSPRLPS